MPYNRWARVDIKSVSLLPNVLAKQAAREQGAREAWFVDAKGFVTEGSSTNAWIVTAGGEVVTRPADHSILNGISRAVVLDAVAALGLAGRRPSPPGGAGGPGGVRDRAPGRSSAGGADRRQASGRRASGGGRGLRRNFTVTPS